MPCYTPLVAYEITAKHNQKANGKKTILFQRPQTTIYKEVQIQCGQCIGCRLKRSTIWATRIMHEISTTPNETASFITLTYDDKHLPSDSSLRKEHFQKFIKRFRKAISPQKIRYFMCGEYGDQSWRPHYHAIIFGYDFTQGIQYKKEWCGKRQQVQVTDVNNPYFISPLLTALWEKGNHILTNATFDTAAYVARYVTKKVNGEKADQHYNRLLIDWNEFTGEIDNFQEVQLEPEYATMSRGRDGKRGIGHEWYQKYKSDCYPSNYLIKDGSKIPIPNYYDKLLEEEDEVLYKQIKMDRELAIVKHSEDLTPERLKQRHYAKRQQNKTLLRNKI